MTKTKFLSKVLSVLLALTMLCSTGVFADYDRGLTAGDAAVTGAITMTGSSLNSEIPFWSATTPETAKWFDVNDGFRLGLKGTTDAATGIITYVVAPVNTFAADPFDPVLMEATAIAIGTADIADSAFHFTIEADPARIVKDTTYELRLAYSKTEIADVTDASALVYQRYFKSFDWADAAKATRVINKAGIGDITIDIETNPIRNAVIDASTINVGQKKGVIAAPLHIRTADLKTGDAFQIASSARVPSDFMWAGETTQTEVVTTSERGAAFIEVGANLRGGVVLAQATSEQGRFFGGNAQTGNAAYRFKANNSGEIYLLAKTAFTQNGWTKVTTGVGTIDTAKATGLKYNGYLYTTRAVTLEDVQTLEPEATELTTENIYNFLKANTDLLVKAGDDKTAAGWYHGAGSNSAKTLQETTYHGLDEAFVSQDGYFQMPTKWTDENGEWELYYDYPNFMGIYGDYGYSGTFGRGWLRQPKPFAATAVYTRTFEAGEWVEIPYDASVAAEDVYSAAVLQFDVPAASLASASVTTTKAAVFSDALPMLAGEAVAFEGENYEIVVPRGTETVSFTVANVNGAESDAVTATMDAASKVVKATIGDVEYDITVKYDDAYPTIYNYKNNSSYDKHNRIAIQYGDMGTPKVGGKKTNAPDGSALTSLAFANGAVKPALTKDLLVIGAYDNKGQSHMKGFDWKEKTRADGMSFNVSKGATVYVLSVARGNVGSPSLEAADFEQVGTLAGYPLYAKHFNADEAVSIPTEPVTQAELDAYNATLTGTKRWAFVDDTNKNLKLDDGTTAIPSGAVGLPIQWNIDAEGNLVSAVNNTGKNVGDPVYYTRGQSTTFYVEFDTPLALGEVTYAVDGGDADAIAFADGETTANIELPYYATTVSVAATKTGTGTVTVAPAELDLTGVASGTVTVTLAAPGAEPIVYTINFVKGAPKLLWESAIAPTGSLKTQSQGIYSSIYKDGLYNVGAQEGELDLTATEIDLVVPYGVEVVKFNGDVSVNLLSAENHAATATVTINGTDYTVNVSWAAYEYKEGMPRLYDLEYGVEGKTGLYAENRYYAIPKALVLNAEHEYVLGTGDLKGTDGNGKVTVNKAEGTWFTTASHNNVNLSSTNNGAQVNRLHLGPQAFQTWVDNGDLDSIYALNGATILVADYTDEVANDAVRYKFKAAHAGYVIVACRAANSNFAAANGWTRLEGNTMQFTNSSTTAQGTALAIPPEGHTNSAKSFAEWAGACNYIYMKKVAADEVIEIKESNVASQYPPVVIVATEDMINERIVAPTVLESLSYTTALAVTDPEDSVGANGHSAKSLHANGFYQPTLVTEAATVAVAADATTVNVTVPYGTEIVNLAGVDNYEGAVEFDAINLINNNGAATVTKTVGEVTYTINVAWAAYDASADPAGNMVYDVKYRIKDLANTTYYNIVPTKLVLTENRIAPMDVDGYKLSGETYKLVANAGEWYDARLVGGAGSNLLTHNKGAQINRGRASLIAFDGWVRNGLVTASGFPGAALPEDATDAEVDAIAYAAMNGATTLVVNYTDYTDLAAAAGANAAMAEHLTFKVAQDSIVYVSSSSSSIGAEWTKVSAGKLYLHNQVNDPIYGKNEDDTYTQLFKNSYIHHDYSAGGYAYYRYAKAGDTVSLTLNTVEKNMPPVVLVRPIDFTAAQAPALDTISYKIGDGEATAVEFAEGATEATIEVPWGNTDAISLAATISGQGSVSVSDAIALSKENREGAITVTLTDVLGEAAGTYTVNFVWADAPAVESITYSTARTLYKGAVVENAELTAETQEIEVPWGTANVTVSYKIEGADAVALKAVNLVDGVATVAVDLPEETITLTFVESTVAPAGQYITGLTKYPNSWRDRMFASYGDVDGAYVGGASGYKPSGAQFFSENRVPEGLAKAGEIVVIADAAANQGQGHMALTNFPYMANAYPATAGDGSDAWMSFTVAKAGKLYAVPAQFDEVWVELENLGWTEAPFDLSWAGGHRKVYQRDVAAGELVYMPGAQILDREIEAYNEYLAENEAGYSYKRATEEDIAAINAAIAEMIAAGTLPETAFKGAGTVAGDILRVNDEGAEVGSVTINDTVYTRNVAGFYIYSVDAKNKNGIELQFGHYTRTNAPVLFAVAEANVDATAKAPKYTGEPSVAADGTLELSAIPAAYAEKSDAEFTYAIKEGAEYATIEGTTLKPIRENWVEGAEVVIEIKQGDLVGEATIAIVAVDALKYGYLTIEAADGNGGFAGVVDGETIIENNPVENMEFLIGTVVTLTATPDEGSEFRYWARVDANGTTVYSTDAELVLAVPYGITLKPVFKVTDSEDYMVTFKGHQNAILETYALSTVEGDTIIAPDAPEVFGYEFKYYEVAGWTDTYAAGAEIAKSLIGADTVFTAKYEQKAEMKYTITVANGTITATGDKAVEIPEGATTAEVTYNKWITVEANPAEEGMKFSHWAELGAEDTAISYNESYRFYVVAADRTVVAVYVAADAEVEVEPVVTMTVATIDGEAAEPIYGLYAERRVPEDLAVVENGIVYGYAGNNYGLTEESESVTLENYNGKSTSKYQNNNGQYTVRVQMTEARQDRGDKWYASTYLIYRDANGVLQTVYSPKKLFWEKAE